MYFVSDDGYLYCLDAEKGTVVWKFRGGPSDRKVLGNSRLISMWPARGGPVIKDGVVYFAASIWPFMGTFIHALEAETGDVLAVQTTGAYNHSMASNYNRFTRPPVIFVADGRADLVYRRETLEDLVRCDVMPERLK